MSGDYRVCARVVAGDLGVGGEDKVGIVTGGVEIGSIQAFGRLKVSQFVGREFVGLFVGIVAAICGMFVGRGVFGLAVGIKVRGSGGGWQWLAEHRSRKEGMVGENFVVEFRVSRGSQQLLALELKSGNLLGLIVGFH